MKIILLSIIFLFVSCSQKEENKNISIKPVNKEIKVDKKKLEEFKKRLAYKQKKVVKLKVDKKNKLIIGQKRMEAIDSSMKYKNDHKDNETLKVLQDLKEQKKANRARNIILSDANKKVNVSFYDEVKNILKPVVLEFTLRNLTFKNDIEKLYLNTISFSYEKEYKKINIEILDYDKEKFLNIIKNMKKKNDKFIYKNYFLEGKTIHVAIAYEYRIMNIIYEYYGYTWNINVKNDISDAYIDIISSINYERFRKLKEKYDK